MPASRSRCGSSGAIRGPGLKASIARRGEVNYLRGSDPAAWHTGVARYSQVAYRELWPGIDLRLREQSGVAEVRVPRPARRATVGHPPRLRTEPTACRSMTPARC